MNLTKTKPSEYKKRIQYSITCSPHDDHQYKMDKVPTNRLKAFQLYIKKYILNPLNDLGVKYEMNIELSHPMGELKPDSFSRLHLHGIIEFPNRKVVRNWLLCGIQILTRVGYTKINPIISDKQLSGWKDYISKQDYLQLGCYTNLESPTVLQSLLNIEDI